MVVVVVVGEAVEGGEVSGLKCVKKEEYEQEEWGAVGS